MHEHAIKKHEAVVDGIFAQFTQAAIGHLNRAYEALAPFRAVGLDTRVVDAEIDLARLALTLEAR